MTTYETLEEALALGEVDPADDAKLAAAVEAATREEVYHCVVCGKKAQGGRLFCHKHRKAHQQPVPAPQPSPRPMQFVAGENWRSAHAGGRPVPQGAIGPNGWDNLVKIYEDAQDGL